MASELVNNKLERT